MSPYTVQQIITMPIDELFSTLNEWNLESEIMVYVNQLREKLSTQITHSLGKKDKSVAIELIDDLARNAAEFEAYCIALGRVRLALQIKSAFGE